MSLCTSHSNPNEAVSGATRRLLRGVSRLHARSWLSWPQQQHVVIHTHRTRQLWPVAECQAIWLDRDIAAVLDVLPKPGVRGSGYPDCRRVRGFGASGAEADHADTTSGALSLQRDPCIKQTAHCAPLLASAHIRKPYITYCILNHGTPEGAELRARRYAQPVRGGSANGVRASPARDRRDAGLGGCVYSSLVHAVATGSCAMELN